MKQQASPLSLSLLPFGGRYAYGISPMPESLEDSVQSRHFGNALSESPKLKKP
jgi:hypothetical protein